MNRPLGSTQAAQCIDITESNRVIVHVSHTLSAQLGKNINIHGGSIRQSPV
jgi:hypothetical protein